MDEKVNELLGSSLKFNLACFAKLREKQKLGWIGWDKPENKRLLEAKLIQHIKKPLTRDNLIDISNFCNFLWNLKEGTKVRKIEII